MNELMTLEKKTLAEPLTAGIEKALSIFESVKSFDDLERLFLMGSGLSVNTYRSYLTSIRAFYKFNNGLNPLQVTPGNIESFYDDLIKNGSTRNTAMLRISGLKKFFICIKKVVPIYQSPFDIMEKKLLKKLSKNSTGNRELPALTIQEVNAVLEYLKELPGTYAKQNYAIAFMLASSGLRASELVQLRWCDIVETEKGTICYFTGKGDKKAEQELWPAALEACKMAYLWTHKNHPDMRSKDVLFWTVPTYSGDISRPLQYHALYERIRGIGEAVNQAKVISREFNFAPHMFRRTYASNLNEAEMDIVSIQKKMRHSSVNTTMRYIKNSKPAKEFLSNIYSQKSKQCSKMPA